MVKFVGLIFLSKYSIRLSEKGYWSIDPDLLYEAFAETMTQIRFI